MKKINFKVITLFPDLIQSYLADAILSKALQKQLLGIEITDLRKFSQKKYNSVDDTVFGGGDGMLLQYRPLVEAFQSVVGNKVGRSVNTRRRVIYLSPQGQRWTHRKAKSLLQYDDVVLISGRYAGVDQRFISKFVDEEISLGDFVLSGGELGVLAIIESTSRYIPGVLGDEVSAQEDSFENDLLEAPQFSKPQVEDEMRVPAVLLSGNHQKIQEWRKMCSVLVTLKKRPDLLENRADIPWETVKEFYYQLNESEKCVLGLLNLEWP